MSRHISKDKREQIKEEAGWQCHRCGYGMDLDNPDSEGLTIDHIVPYNRSHCSGDFNLQSLCWDCNLEKSDGEPEVIDMLQPEDEFGEPAQRINLADKDKLSAFPKDAGFGGLPKFRLW